MPSPECSAFSYEHLSTVGTWPLNWTRLVSQWPLTGAQALLQEADLLAEGVDAVQLLEGVGQERGLLRQALVQ